MTVCEQITELFPIRKTVAQKKAFRQWVMAEIAEMGYSVRVEQNDNGRQQNIVVGDPEHAQVLPPHQKSRYPFLSEEASAK